MMKAVLDSNIFVSCMNPQSDYYVIFQKLVEGDYNLFVTTDIIMEYLEVFQMKFSGAKTQNLFRYLSESAFVINTPVYFKWGLIKADADDNKFVDCAIAAGADFIVTNDNHFKELSKIEFPAVKFITMDAFLNILLSKEK